MKRKEKLQKAEEIFRKYADLAVLQQALGHKHIRSTLNYASRHDLYRKLRSQISS